MGKKIRTLDSFEEDYFRDHPEEVDEYISLLFEEYAKDENMAALLSSLRIICRVKGITAIAEHTGMTRNGLQKVLTDGGNPKFENFNSIMHAMGYKLLPHKMDENMLNN